MVCRLLLQVRAVLPATQTKNDLLLQNTSSRKWAIRAREAQGIGGIETLLLKGNPDQAGLYTILLRVPAHARIAAHSHRDDRVASVIFGTSTRPESPEKVRRSQQFC